jgi:peptidoglycan/LPS O-acetylase OafA/YrhL
MQFGKNLATGLPYQIALMIAALAITIAFALAFARLIERPSIQVSRQIAA